MEKKFEDYFSEKQADMVSVCLENVENRAEKIYIYTACECKQFSGFAFYKINGMFVKLHKLNDAIAPSDVQYDVSSERQRKVLRCIIADLEKLYEVCKEFDKPMPTVIKLIYDVATNKLNAEYNYELMYTNTKDKLPDDFYEVWLDEIKKSG